MANSDGFKTYSGLLGSKVITVGKEDSVFNYTAIETAVAAANPKDIIKVYPGTYTLTETLDVIKDISIIGVGSIGDVVITSALATTPTIAINVPVSHNASVDIHFEDLTIVNSAAGSALEIDNDGGAAQNLGVDLKDCSINNSAAGYAVELLHTTATKDILLAITGNPVMHTIGYSLFTQTKAASIVFMLGMNCEGVFELDASAVAATFDMIGCIYADAAQTTGGGATRLMNYVGCIYGASGLAAGLTKGAATDFDATATEFWASYA